eukprot:CAMPEP_0201530012 /NCGR_PEP_ID=MMETSP0161_2-20130828/43488_1 /ASSEMBLY_ACC=CAM_ASM_000251 /TAXON_ID=180227 /ORGANISM="Neoparamoeba aestuarina, Strain SoJaBio B1-5/56/2" /LENGTH=361 /DNA_ID=CAMNT_0047932125 /DNA_START=51 /DNA_END=1133 /DNA_ORIENTATION=-
MGKDSPLTGENRAMTQRLSRSSSSKMDYRPRVTKSMRGFDSPKHQSISDTEETNLFLKADCEDLERKREKKARKIRTRKPTKELWEQVVELQNQVDLLMAKEHLSGTPEENKIAIQSKRYLVFVTLTQYSDTQCPWGFLKVTSSGEWRIEPTFTKNPKFFFKVEPKRRSFALSSVVSGRYMSVAKGATATSALSSGPREQITVQDKIWHMSKENKTKKVPFSLKSDNRTVYFANSGVPMRTSLVTVEVFKEWTGRFIVMFEGERGEEKRNRTKLSKIKEKGKGKKLQKNTSSPGLQKNVHLTEKPQFSKSLSTNGAQGLVHVDKKDREAANKTVQQIQQTTKAQGFLGFCDSPSSSDEEED